MATKRSAKERRRSRRRAAMVLVPTVAGVFIAGTAFAYWTTSGNGTGTAQTGTNASVTVTQLTPFPTALAPGSGDQPITFKINNPKVTKQYIASVTIALDTITNVVGGAVATSCLPADFTITQPTAINADLSPGDTSYTTLGAAIRMTDTAVNQDACKNVNLNLTFAAA